MLIKLALVFLIVMAGVAMLGNLIHPGALMRRVRRRLTAAPKPMRCARCNRPQIGRTCDCDKKG